MKRREFITLLGGVAAVADRGTRAAAAENADHRVLGADYPLSKAKGLPHF
jgi:hypothetical protein